MMKDLTMLVAPLSPCVAQQLLVFKPLPFLLPIHSFVSISVRSSVLARIFCQTDCPILNVVQGAG